MKTIIGFFLGAILMGRTLPLFWHAVYLTTIVVLAALHFGAKL